MDTLIRTGQSVPYFSLLDMDGKPHTPSDYRGKVVVLHFWSAGCQWVKRADGILAGMRSAWGDRVTVLSISSNVDETLEEITSAMYARGVAPVLVDSDQHVARLFSALVTPHIVIIDPTGVVRYQGGFDDANLRQPEPTRNYLWEAVEAVLAGERPDPGETPAFGCSLVYRGIEKSEGWKPGSLDVKTERRKDES